jgi:hypothetical protein
MARSGFATLIPLTLMTLLVTALPSPAEHRGGGGPWHGGGGYFHEGFYRGSYFPYRGYFPGFVGIDIGLGYGYGYPYYGAPVYVVPAPLYVQPPPTIIQAPPPATPAPATPERTPEPVPAPRLVPVPAGS